MTFNLLAGPTGPSGPGANLSPSLIVNREFMVDQRNEGTLVADNAPGAGWLVDQYYSSLTAITNNCYNCQRITTGAPSGFSTFLRLTMTGTAPAVDQGVGIAQDLLPRPELAFGTSSPLPLVAVLVIRASVDCSLTWSWQPFGAGNDFAHLIPLTANVWQTISFPVPGDTGADINTGHGSTAMLVLSTRGAATQIAADSWVTSAPTFAVYTSGQTDMTTHTGATVDIAGFDMRIGSAPVPFLHDSFSNYLTECQNFYRKTFTVGRPEHNWVGVIPAQNIGDFTNSLQCFASFGGISPMVLWDYGEMVNTPTITLFNPHAADGNWGLIFGGAGTTDEPAGVPSVGKNRALIFQNSGGATANYGMYGIHAVADGGL